MATYVKHFDTITEVLEATQGATFGYRNEWYGNVSSTQARKYALSGFAPLMEQAEKLVDKIDMASTSLSTLTTTSDVWGPRMSIGEYLAGSPTCFRRKKRQTENIAPMKILVCTTCSASIEAKQMIARGAAILALLMKLQTFRPVDLFLTSEVGNSSTSRACLATVRIESRPLNLASASFVIGHVGFSRGLLYEYARTDQGMDGSFPSSNDCQYHYGDRNRMAQYHQQLAQHLDFNLETDLYIPAAYATDQLLTDPVAWINAQLARYGAANEDGE